MPTRFDHNQQPTARTILIETALDHGWLHKHAGRIDVFLREGVAVHVGWTQDRIDKIATGSGRSRDGEFTNRDYGPMCVLHARDWLRMPSDYENREVEKSLPRYNSAEEKQWSYT